MLMSYIHLNNAETILIIALNYLISHRVVAVLSETLLETMS